MVLTKQDLQDWNSHPVTIKVMSEIDNAITEAAMASVVRDTVDQTAMQAAYQEGMIEGAKILKETYEELLEDSE